MRISDWSSDVCSSDLVLLHIGDHEVADDPHLVGVRGVVAESDLGDDSRVLGVAHVEDGGAVGRLHVADVGIAVLHHHLAAARQVEVSDAADVAGEARSEEHTSELQSLMRISYAVFCLKKQRTTKQSDIQQE